MQVLSSRTTSMTTVKMPAIIAVWHGQHFLMPFIKKNEGEHRAKVLISRHRDGEINARAAERLGIETIRGSGAHNGEFDRKGGAAAFTQMLDALADGYNVAMTADVPKVARVAGLGIVKLAQISRRPIYPVAIAIEPPQRIRTIGTAPPSICRSGAWRSSAAIRSLCRRTRMRRSWKQVAAIARRRIERRHAARLRDRRRQRAPP